MGSATWGCSTLNNSSTVKVPSHQSDIAIPRNLSALMLCDLHTCYESVSVTHWNIIHWKYVGFATPIKPERVFLIIAINSILPRVKTTARQRSYMRMISHKMSLKLWHKMNWICGNCQWYSNHHLRFTIIALLESSRYKDIKIFCYTQPCYRIKECCAAGSILSPLIHAPGKYRGNLDDDYEMWAV